MIFQHFNLLSSRTVEENIALPLEIAGFSKSEIKERVSEIIPLVGLEDKQYNYVGTLSGGQKQRVGIARALANRPQLLLCDEATSALDPQNTAAILELLKDINKKLGLTIVLITHEMEVVKKVSDHVSFMADGKILESNSVIGIMSNPKHPLLRSFLQNDEDKLANFIKEQKHIIDPGALLVRLIFIGEITREAVPVSYTHLHEAKSVEIAKQVLSRLGFDYRIIVLIAMLIQDHDTPVANDDKLVDKAIGYGQIYLEKLQEYQLQEYQPRVKDLDDEKYGQLSQAEVKALGVEILKLLLQHQISDLKAHSKEYCQRELPGLEELLSRLETI